MLTSIVRLLFEDLAQNRGAGLAAGQREKLEAAAALITERAPRIVGGRRGDRSQLQSLVDEWMNVAESKPGLVYWLRNNWEGSLLVDTGRDAGQRGHPGLLPGPGTVADVAEPPRRRRREQSLQIVPGKQA